MKNSLYTMDGQICRVILQESQLNQQEDVFLIIDTILETESPIEFIMDCSYIQRLNSNGIGRLVYLKRYINDEKKIPVRLENLNPQTLKTLKSVKVDQLLGINI